MGRFEGRPGLERSETVTGLEKRTPLYDEHLRAGARMTPFGGFVMPVQYAGIIEEHRTVRSRAGLFDLSHMGELRVSGPDALRAIDRLVTNSIHDLAVWQVRYTPMCLPSGGIVDDLLVYRFPDHLMLVVNASNVDKDFAWVRRHAGAEVVVENISDLTALIAIQGPESERVLQAETDLRLEDIPYYHFRLGRVGGVEAVVSRTGYTGEGGFELYVAPADAPSLWRRLLDGGAGVSIRPIGLGARDTLRLEAGYMLYGNDIDDRTTPLEAGLGWTVKFGPHDFVGRAALERRRAEGLPRRLMALRMLDRAIPRPHSTIMRAGEPIGEVTSGTFSPTFERGIALGYIRTGSANGGDTVDVDIRGSAHPAEIVRKPMYKREGG